MKILLINGWSDDNKGDSAILQGLMKLIGNVVSKQSHFSIISNFSSKIHDFQRHYRFVQQIGDRVSVHGSLLPIRIPTGNSHRLGRALARVYLLIRSLIILLLAPNKHVGLLLDNNERASLAAFIGTDLVISKGGHIYFSTGGLLSLIGLYQNLYPLLLAQRLKKPTVIFGQSIGPIKGRLQRLLLRRALARTGIVYVREPLSLALSNELLTRASGGNASLTWDTAFFVDEEPLPSVVADSLPARFIALTVRQWKFPYRGQESSVLYTRYLSELAELIRVINRELALPVVLVPQVIGPTPLENDLQAHQDLEGFLSETDDYVSLSYDFTPGQLKTLYQRSEVLIGTRFHSVILALSGLTPAIAISYHGYKTKGIMEMLGLGKLVFEIDDINHQDLWGVLRKVYEKREVYRSELNHKIDSILNEGADSVQLMIKLLGHDRDQMP